MRFHFDFNLRNITFAILIGATATSVVACDPTPSEQSGELGNGDFLYPCDTSTLHCDATSHDADYGAGASSFYVSSGSKFKIDFQRPANKADIDTIRPISTTIIDRASDGYFTANREGWGGFYAVNPGGQIVDFSEVQIKKPATISINAHSNGNFTPDTNDFQQLVIQLVNGTDLPVFNLLANLHSSDNSLLHGEVALDWKVTDPTVASISNITGHMSTLTANKRGTTTLTVTGAGITRTATLEVQ
jgi:hypothetical protein